MVKSLFEPKSIAVIGASRDEKKVGHIILKNLKEGFKGKLFAVNPFADKILGIKCYESLEEINEKIDLGVFAVKAEVVIEILERAENLKNAVIISSGFGEVGNFKLEEKLKEIGKRKGIRILGPNCFGYQNPWLGINTTFSKMCSKGKIAIVSQSGALGAAFIDFALSQNIGISKFVSVGNMVDVDFADIIEYLNKDKETESILAYLEGLKDGRKFFRAVRKLKKQLFILKAGKSRKGAETAKTHTGALAGEYLVYQGIFRQLGVKELSCIEDFFWVAKLLNNFGNGKKEIVGITNAGGCATLFADACERYGVRLKDLSKKEIERLNKILPKMWNRKNPADIIGDATPERFEKVIESLRRKNRILVVMVTPQQMTHPKEVARRILKYRKDCCCVFVGGKEMEEARERLRKEGVLCFDWVDECARILRYISE